MKAIITYEDGDVKIYRAVEQIGDGGWSFKSTIHHSDGTETLIKKRWVKIELVQS